MQTDAHNMGREERRALFEQRRAAIARQLRRLAIELTDLDKQLDETEQWRTECNVGLHAGWHPIVRQRRNWKRWSPDSG